MKILCVIDSLGSGGAQRQMVNLACGLKAKGHEVELFVYFPKLDFFRAEVDAAGIVVHEVSKGRGFSLKVVWRLVQLYRYGRFNGVISFLDSPNIYAELAKLLALSRIKLIVSERSSFIREGGSMGSSIRRWCHLLANRVVANSHTHADWLRKHFWLARWTQTIYNGYLLPPVSDVEQSKDAVANLTFLVVGRINTGKNGLRLLKGLIRFYQAHGDCPTVFWAGRQEQDSSSLLERQQMEQLLAQYPDIARRWEFLGERRDIPDLLQQADALIHVSLYEGLPNAVCEAFVAARPVIASKVCDHPELVEEGVRGFLCDPLSPESICEIIDRFVSLKAEERHQMGYNARVYSEKYLSIDRMVSDYERLLF
jgi:glycosyltransferase involved in cell wall biosynthesis